MHTSARRPVWNLRLPAAAVVLALTLLSASSRADPAARPAIDAAELVILVRSGQEIVGRTIPAAALVQAILMPPDPAGNDRRIAVTNSEIVDPLDLARRLFRREFVFRDVVFADTVDLTGASTDSKLTFAGKTRFVKDVTLNQASFQAAVAFEGEVVFERSFEAQRATFLGETSFEHATF
jgi:hypothetical protein